MPFNFFQWKRKSFKRANGYDASDVVERVPSSSFEDAELIPLRRQPSSSAGASLRANQPPSSSNLTPKATASDLCDLEAAMATAGVDEEDVEDEEEEDIDKVIASVTRPKLTSGSASRTPSRASHPMTTASGPRSTTVGGELATLGFTNRNDYWEHSAFGRSRLTAIVLALAAIVGLLYCLGATTWVYSGFRKFPASHSFSSSSTHMHNQYCAKADFPLAIKLELGYPVSTWLSVYQIGFRKGD